jgi:hypothetical protein
MQRFDLKKLNDEKVKKQHQVKISNKLLLWKTWMIMWTSILFGENIRENIQFSAKESLGHNKLKCHKTLFGEECSKLLNRRKQAKLNVSWNPSQMNGDNLNDVRREASKTFRTNFSGPLSGAISN